MRWLNILLLYVYRRPELVFLFSVEDKFRLTQISVFWVNFLVLLWLFTHQRDELIRTCNEMTVAITKHLKLHK